MASYMGSDNMLGGSLVLNGLIGATARSAATGSKAPISTKVGVSIEISKKMTELLAKKNKATEAQKQQAAIVSANPNIGGNIVKNIMQRMAEMQSRVSPKPIITPATPTDIQPIPEVTVPRKIDSSGMDMPWLHKNDTYGPYGFGYNPDRPAPVLIPAEPIVESQPVVAVSPEVVETPTPTETPEVKKSSNMVPLLIVGAVAGYFALNH